MSNTSLLIKRLIYESQKEFLNKSGIYLIYNTDDLTRMKLLIIGPDKTPYQNGFYLFQIIFPFSYPLTPPKFTFMTRYNNIRFHPNLYAEGYVCLSILNTWGKKDWSPCQTISAICSTIQSILNDNPIINEPDFENEVGVISQNYYKIVEYNNLKYAVLETIKNIPLEFKDFEQIIKDYFIQKFDTYLEIIEKNKSLHNEIVTCQIYSITNKLDYKKIKEDFHLMKDTLIIKDKDYVKD